MTTIRKKRMTGKAAIPVLLIIIFLAMYFIVFDNKPPKEIAFQGHTLGPREETEYNSIKDFRIFSYKDVSGNHMLLLLMLEDDSATVKELLAVYVGIFKAQGFKFRTDGDRHLGLKGDEVIYLTIAANLDSVIGYLEKDPDRRPAKPDDAESLYSALEIFSFD